MKKLRKQSVKAAIGRMADDINGDNNRKVLQTLRDAMFEQFDVNIIGNAEIQVYNVQKAVSEYSYYFKIEFVDVDNPNDSIYLYIVSDEQSTGKFKCYLTEYTISEPFDRNTDVLETFIIRMSGSKSALSHEIKRIASGIYNENNSKGHINASRGGKNMKKFIKANNRPAPRRRTINAANERNDLVITKINDYSTWPNDKRPFDIPVIGYGKDEFEADGTHYVAYYDKETHTYSSVEKVPDYHRVEARYRIKNPNENIKLEDIKEYFSTKSIDAACGKKRNIKAALYDNAYEDIEISRDAYIQQWQDEYEGEPSTSWDHIFDMILDDFVLYCGDEASTDETGKTIEEKYESGEYTSADVEDEFDNWIMWISLDDYDYE